MMLTPIFRLSYGEGALEFIRDNKRIDRSQLHQIGPDILSL